MISKAEIFEGKIIYKNICSNDSILELFKSLNQHFSEEYLSPELVLYSSYNKLTETKYIKDISLNDSVAFLLFDMHLLDFLGEFEEIYIEEKYYLNLTRRLIYRALAESFFIKGRFHEALYCAYKFTSSDGYIKFTKERSKKIAQSLLIQECFVLCHELSHWYLFRCNISKDNLIHNKKELYLEYLNKLIKKRKEKLDIDGVKLLSEMKEYINTQDKIIEECACDTFATVFLIKYMDDSNSYNIIDIINNSFISIQSLQLLSFVDRYTDAILGYPENSEKIYFEMTLRMIIYKTYFGNYLGQYHKDIASIFEKEIVNCIDRYSEHIKDYFKDLLDEISAELFKLRNIPEITFLDDSWETIYMLIKQILYIDDK